MEYILIRQKEKLLNLVGSGEYDRALVILEFIAEFWVEMDYAYKGLEILDVICRHQSGRGTAGEPFRLRAVALLKVFTDV